MDTTSLFYLFAYLLGLLILYLIVRGAVMNATAEMKRSLKISNHLKKAQMKKEGFSDEDITKIINEAK